MLAVAVALLLLAVSEPAAASVGVASNAARPTLRVDAKGNAEISYTNGDVRKTVLVPVRGAVLPGGRLEGRDVSRAATRPALPYMKVLRRGPGGWFYALQTWPSRVGPVEIRFSRWKGGPTRLTLKAKRQKEGIALQGRVTYAGKAIPTTSRTPGGTVLRQYVYLEQRVEGRWRVLGGVAVERNGTYRKVLYGAPTGTRFRASVAGPNIGTVYAPDMIVHIPPP